MTTINSYNSLYFRDKRSLMTEVMFLLLLVTSVAYRCQAFSSSVLHSSSLSTQKITTYQYAARSICTFDETDFAGNKGDWPYMASDLNRLDNSVDSNFYDAPRFVTHIDDGAIASLTSFYKEELSRLDLEKVDILDMCSSWISHLPDEGVNYGNIIGLGMNREELEANKQLTEYIVQDLNENPIMSFEDNSFDVICNVVSVDYLTKPLEIFQEMHRVLRPGGVALMSFSNRCFPTKAIAMWLQADDIGRLTIVASYFHYSADWKGIEALDLKETQQTPERPSAQEIFKNPSLGLAWMNAASAVARNNQGDPMFVVKATKQ